MRCLSCQVILSAEEATRKSPVTQDYFDMCNTCLGLIAADIPNSFDRDDSVWELDSEFIDDEERDWN